MAVSGALVKPNQSLPLCFRAPTSNSVCRKQLCIRALATSSEGKEPKMIRKEKDGWKIDFSGEKPATPLLDTINYPVHMKNLSTQDLEQLAAELRADVVHTVSKTGGQLHYS